MPDIPETKAYEIFKKMHKNICPSCIGKDKKCPKCEGYAWLFKIDDEIMKEIKTNESL